MSKWFFLTLWCSFTCLANQTGSDFDTLKNYAKSLSAQPKESMNAFNPHSLFDNYSEHPEQEGYYQGIQTEKTDLSSSAQAAIQNDQAARIVIDNFGRNQFELNLSSSVLAQSQLIQDESYAIVHGISNDRVQCDSQAPVCEMKTHEEQCFSSRLLPDQTCSKTLKVIVESEKVMQRADFSLWWRRNGLG